MTLIEIIIALFVFAVGILAVVRVITTNIAVIDTMKLKIQAQSLAKEGADIIFNIRDTNLARGTSWNCAYLTPDAISAIALNKPFNGDVCDTHIFDDGAKFRVGLQPDSRIAITTTTTGNDFVETFDLNKLGVVTGNNNYTGEMFLDGQGGESYFARYISFSAVYQSGDKLDSSKLLKVTSHVLYKK